MQSFSKTPPVLTVRGRVTCGSMYLHGVGGNLTTLCPIYAGTPESALAFGERGSLKTPSLATCLFRRHATSLASRFLAAFRRRHVRLYNSSWVAVHVRRGDKVALHGCNTTVAGVRTELQRQLGKVYARRLLQYTIYYMHAVSAHLRQGTHSSMHNHRTLCLTTTQNDAQ